MTEETVLLFSVAGLTVRGLDFNVDNWVPKKGQRLSCSRSSSGCIEVFKDGQRVGLVAKEAPNTCKEWLKCNGEMEAVVISVPKKHRNKGREVPVVFVFKSVKSCLMENIKRGIKSGIDSLQKKKKSVKFEEGDSTENMVFSDDENEFEFCIHGMCLRGFRVYKNYWVPEIGERRKCSMSASKSVEIVKDGTTVGNVEKDGQELFRKFINAGGDIYAVVVRGPKANKSKGEEIPVVYEFSGQEWTNRLKNVRIEIKDEILKRSKKKKSLKFICSTYNPDSLPGTSGATQEMTDGHGEYSKMLDKKVKGSHKRRSDELPKGSPSEKVARRESSVDDTNSDQKSSESETKREVLLQAPSSVSEPGTSSATEEMTDENGHGDGCKMPDRKPGTSSATEEMTDENGHGEGSKMPDRKVRKGSKKNSRMPEETTQCKPLSAADKNTPKKSASSSKASKKSASVSKTPNSGNKITNYFTPKSSQSVKSVVENVKEINSVRKKILQKEDAKGDNVEEQNKGDISYEKGDMNGDLHSKKSFGQLIDVHGHVETVLDIRTKLEASKSVCKIVQGNNTATGFRVGSRYIMTAAHVTKTFQQGLKFEIQTYAVFNYIKDGILKEENKFFFKEVVYTDAELDISVIELIESSHPFPPSFTTFDVPSLDRCFHLIGHSQGNVMGTNQVTKIVNINNPEVRDHLERLQKLSYEHTGKCCDDPPDNTLDNPHRFLFHCKFTKGGSGSPGIVLIDEKVIVTTVLLHGYPDWYYDPSMERYKMNWLPENCIEQGVNMMSVRKKMLQTNLALCINIFGQTLQQ